LHFISIFTVFYQYYFLPVEQYKISRVDSRPIPIIGKSAVTDNQLVSGASLII